jgi:hypothetical protein
MSSPIKAGILIGILVTIWTYICGFAGWYKDPNLAWTFQLVVLIEIVVLVWLLRKTAAEGRTYGGQVVGGLTASLVGAVIIFVGSYLWATVFFPNYQAELRAMGEQVLSQQGRSPQEIETLLNAQAAMSTPVMQALFGAIGTIVTGLVVSAILAIFLRARPAPVVPAESAPAQPAP